MRCKLKDLGIVSTGNTPSKSNEAFYDSDDIGFVKPDILSDCSITEKIVVSEYISDNARSKARIVKDGAVFVTCIGSIGKVGVADGEYAFNQQINAIQPNQKVSSKYLAYCMLYNKKALQAIANAPVVPIINKSQFEEFELEIEEDTSEQKRIVEILDKVNGVLESRKRELQELDNLIKSRFVEMFGNKGENPNGYSEDSLGNLYKFQYGKGNNIPEDKGEYPCYGSNGIVGHHTEFNSEDAPIIGHIGAYAGSVNWGAGKHYVTYNGVICKLKTDRINPIYGFYLLQQQDFNRVATKGGGQPFVSYGDLESPTVVVPPIEIQNDYAMFANQVDKLKFEVKKSLDETQKLMDSLMQQYFG